MVIGNANIFAGGKFSPGSLSFENGVITAINAPGLPRGLDAGGKYLVPGFVDIHTHGARGGDISDGNPEGLVKMSLHQAQNGVTSFLPTTMTIPEDELLAAMRCLREFSRPENGAKVAGVNLEGPFLSHAKRGAQNGAFLRKPDFDLLERLNFESGGMVKIVSVAPEEDAGFDFIKKASRLCTVSLGHTTAGYDTAMAAFKAGAAHVTHLFNAMPPFAHREPGVVGAALDFGAHVELICDGVHIHDSVIRAVFRLFGDKTVAVSDSLRCAGMPDGDYELGGQAIAVKNGRATLPDGTIAGSSSNLLAELRVIVGCGVSLENALNSLTAAPALAAGLYGEIGSLDPGKRADFLLLDASLELCAVFVEGRQIDLQIEKGTQNAYY